MIWLSVALAAPPNQQADLISVLSGPDEGTGGRLDSLHVSDGGEIVVGRLAGATQAFLLDLDTWAMIPIENDEACDGATGVTAFGDGEAVSIWVSCSNGSIFTVNYSDRALSTRADASTQIAGSLSGIFHDPLDVDDLLYAIELPDAAAFAQAHVIDPANPEDLSVVVTNPTPLTQSGLTEAKVVSPGPGGQFSQLVVAHDALGLATPMSTLILNRMNVASPSTQLALCSDLAFTPLANTVYCLDDENDLVQAFQTLTNTFVPIPELTNLSGPRAVGASDSLQDNWIAVTGSQVQVWELDEFGGIVRLAFTAQAQDSGNPIRDIVSADGYLFGGGSSGRLHVVTARPWIDRDSFTLGDGTVTFTVAQANAATVGWELFEGGDRTGSGRQLDSGTVVVGEAQTVEFETDALTEGANDFFVVVTDDDELTGHIAGTVFIDTPPPTPDVRRPGSGDRRLEVEVSLPDGPVADLDRFEVCVALEEFEPSDVAEGDCPPYEGRTNIVIPFEFEADSAETQATISIEPLENDVKHFIAVRTVDEGGNVSDLSRVVSGVPERGQGPSDLANESGGSPCGEGCATSGSPAAWGLGLAGLLAFGFVRRRGMVALAVTMAVGAVAAPVAHAQDDDGGRAFWQRRDSTPVRGDFEFRYGSFALEDEDIKTVHGNSINLWQIEAGPQIFRVLEIDLGIALANSRSPLVNVNNNQPSLDDTRLTIIPLSLDVTGRAHILDEQPVVPFFRYGWDYAFFSDKRVGDEGDDGIRGAKVGTHYGLGLNLLLDALAPNRASLLEAQSGINDTWITLEWRRNRIDDRERPWSEAVDRGLNFSGDVFSVGLKLDY